MVIEERIAAAVIDTYEVATSALPLDMTNSATYIDTGNDRGPIAQRGKAKPNRNVPSLIGLGLVVIKDAGIPLLSHAYPGNKPDVTRFPVMIAQLADHHARLHAATEHREHSEITVVFDAGQNSAANFEKLATTDLDFVGSVPPPATSLTRSPCPLPIG